MPELPPGVAVLWPIYLDLHAARGSTGYGMAPLSYHDIDAYQRVTQTRLTGWEVQTLLAVDRAAMTVANAAQAKKD